MIAGIIDCLDDEERAAYEDVLSRCPTAQLACQEHAPPLHHELGRHAILTVALAYAPRGRRASGRIAVDILTESALWAWTRGGMSQCEGCGELPWPEIHMEPQ